MISLSAFRTLVDYARDGSLFPDSPLHGEDHWRAVASQGLLIADVCNLGSTGRTTAALFGLFHDCRRINDGDDPAHGERAAQALQDCDSLPELDHEFMMRLVQSLAFHDAGRVTYDPIVGIGWDSDRSVLSRCGITPEFRFFSCVSQSDFQMLITAGHEATKNPPSWDEIWHRAFSGKQG